MYNLTVLQKNYHHTQARIINAAKAANRDINQIHLIAVSKTFPSETITELYTLGQKAFGENYVQEWLDKKKTLSYPDIEWHFIGPLQTNKTRAVSEHASWVHTIDRIKIAERLNNQRPIHLEPLNICIQVNISQEPNKHGIRPEELFVFATALKELPNLRLRGLMCIPEATQDVEKLAHQFSHMQKLFQSLLHTGFTVDTLSMGMSADLELAIKYGATHVRIGSAIFGQRNYTTK